MTMGQQRGPIAYPGVVAHLAVHDATAAIKWYQEVLGAESSWRTDGPDGRCWFTELTLQGGSFFLSDEFPDADFMPGMVSPLTLGGSPLALTLYVKDVDALVKRAQAAGAEVPEGVQDQHWGDRQAFVIDPFGYRWSISTRTEELEPRQMREREQQFFREHPEFTPERAREQAERWRREHGRERGPNTPPRRRDDDTR